MDAVDVTFVILNGLWLFLPAMIPNSAAVVFGKLGGPKVDFNRTWRGKRILGDGKSWAGLIGGGITGIVLGLLLIAISVLFGMDECWRYGEFPGCIGILATLSFGALFGDLCSAFIKRRLGMERGQKAPVLDQYDFVAGAMLLTALFFPDWIYATYIEGWHIAALVFLIAIMFLIHRSVNILGYKMGLKKEPW